MSTSDDLPPSAIRSSRNIQKIIEKLQNKYQLKDYIDQLAAFNSHHLKEIADNLRHELQLQGLDDDDLYEIHEFLLITFDGDIMKTENKKETEKRAKELNELINI